MIKELLKSLRQYRKYALLTPLFVLGEVLLEVLIPFATANLIDTINRGADLSMILHTGVALLIMAAFSLGFGTAAGISSSTAAAGFGKNLRRDMFYNIQTFSFATMDNFSTPTLVTRMTTDATNVQMSFMMILRIGLRAPMMITIALVTSFIMVGNLAWVYVFVMVPLAFGLFFVAWRALPIFRIAFRKYDALNESVEENIKGIRVVKSYVREKFETSKFMKASKDLSVDFTKADKLLALNGPMLNVAVSIFSIAIVYFVSQNIIQNFGMQINVGQFSTMFTYGYMILMNLMMFSMIFTLIAMSIESCYRIQQVLEAKTTIYNPEKPITKVQNGAIDFNHVNFSYSKDAERTVLKDIDLHIKPGETVGIIGGTGSAKSTLVQLIPRLYDVNEGSVCVGGVNVRDYDVDDLRDAVSMVLQKNVLFSGTIAENLRWGNENATDDQIIEAARLAQADEFIEKFPEGYNTWIEQGGSNVSGGQKQRLCIARALLKKPKILILDDSTSAVDTKTDALIREGFRRYLPETTKIIIAQRTGSVEDADRILVMNNGRIVDTGTHEELLESSEIYREVYTSQNKQSHDERFAHVSHESKNDNDAKGKGGKTRA